MTGKRNSCYWYQGDLEKLKKEVTVCVTGYNDTMVFFANAPGKSRDVIINIQAERGLLQKKQTVIIQEGKNNFV